MIQKDDVVRLRSHLALSRKKFAQKLGVSESSVEKWERGSSKPRGLSIRALKRLAKQLRRKDAEL